MLARLASCANTLYYHPKEAKSIIAEPPGNCKEVFMELINSKPMLIVEEAVNELHRLSSLCSVITWIVDDNTPEITAIGDTVELLRKGLDTQIKTLDNIQW